MWTRLKEHLGATNPRRIDLSRLEKIVFMGTPDIASSVLEAIIEDGFNVAAAVTQPDRPKGRGNELTPPSVKVTALNHGIRVLQPERAKDPGFIEEIKRIAPDIIVVVAYGQILTKEFLDIPKYGCVNVHASLLPKYRGAAPIQWAIINGDEYAGVTIMQMDAGLDTGDIIDIAKIRLSEDETAGTLFDRLAALGGEQLVKVLHDINAGRAVRTAQNSAESSYVSVIKKDFGKIDFNKSAVEIERLTRGLSPWPSAYTLLGGKVLKIWKALVSDSEIAADAGIPASAEAGTVWGTSRGSFLVVTGDGVLEVLELQIEGKKRMPSSDFLRGYKVEEGTKLMFD